MCWPLRLGMCGKPPASVLSVRPSARLGSLSPRTEGQRPGRSWSHPRSPALGRHRSAAQPFRQPREGLCARERLTDRNIQKRDRKSQGREIRRGWTQGSLLSLVSSELFKHMTGAPAYKDPGRPVSWALALPEARAAGWGRRRRLKHRGEQATFRGGPRLAQGGPGWLLTYVPGGALRTVSLWGRPHTSTPSLLGPGGGVGAGGEPCPAAPVWLSPDSVACWDTDGEGVRGHVDGR